MFQELKKWLYYGFTRDQFKLCRAAIDAHNTGGLSIGCLVMAVVTVVLAFYPGGPGHARGVFYMVAFLLLLTFIYSQIVSRGIIKGSFATFAGVMAFSCIILSFSIWACVIDGGIYITRFLLFAISLQILFIFNALFSIAYNAFIVTTFFMAYEYSSHWFGVEMPATGRYDIINIVIACSISMAIGWYMSYVFIMGLVTSMSIEKERNRYLEESVHDQLTGLNNRRSFEQSIGFYTSVCRHVHQTVCIMMVDIDFFKNYNDHYGHQKGDVVLQGIGKSLMRLIEEEKVYAARVGGEEFIVLWTENRTVEAERVALKLRKMVIDLNIPHEWSQVSAVVTASIGLYVMRGGSQDSGEELYRKADSALYKAKAAGRNCIIRHDSADGSYQAVSPRTAADGRR